MDNKILEDLNNRLRDAMYAAAVEKWKEEHGIVGHVELAPSEHRESEIERIYDNSTFEDNDTILQLMREIEELEGH